MIGWSRCGPRESVGISPLLAGTAPEETSQETSRETTMSLLIVYVALMIAGDFIAYLIGLVMERTVPGASLPVFLAMYFLFLWIAWVIAVRITQPKAQPQSS